jgi:hypothetical protein
MSIISLKFSKPPEGMAVTDVGHVLCKHPDRVFHRKYGDTEVFVWARASDAYVEYFFETRSADPMSVEAWTADTRLIPRVFGAALNGKSGYEFADHRWRVEISLTAVSGTISDLFDFTQIDGWVSWHTPVESAVPGVPDVGLWDVRAVNQAVTVQRVMQYLTVIVAAVARTRHIDSQSGIDAFAHRTKDWLPGSGIEGKVVNALASTGRVARDMRESLGIVTAAPAKKKRGSKAGGLAMERAKAIARILHKHDVDSVVDLGCGNGIMGARVKGELVAMKARKSPVWWGIDSNPKAVRSARKRIDFVCLGDAINPQSRAWHAGAALVMAEFIEHVPMKDVHQLRGTIARMLPKVVIITTPNRERNADLGVPDGEFRDKTHHWEADRQTFRRIIESLKPTPRWRVSYTGAGERNASGYPTQIAVMRPPHAIGRFIDRLDTIEPAPYLEPVDPETGFVTTELGNWEAGFQQRQRGLEMYLQADRDFPGVPETISPPGSDDPELAESVGDALDFYRDKGVSSVVIEKKHMGSRAVFQVDLARDGDGYPRTRAWSRNGRSFLPAGFVRRVGLDIANWLADNEHRLLLPQKLESILIDTEVLPWTATGGRLLRDFYAKLPTAARAVKAAHSAAEPPENVPGITWDADVFARVVNRYAPPYEPGEMTVAPISILAVRYRGGGEVRTKDTRMWQLQLLGDLADSSMVFTPPSWTVVKTSDKGMAGHVFRQMVSGGAEGVVVKPNIMHEPELNTPRAFKVRSAEYLNITYGPGYDPETIARRRRSQKMKRSACQSVALDAALDSWTRGRVSAKWVHRGLAAGIRPESKGGNR